MRSHRRTAQQFQQISHLHQQPSARKESLFTSIHQFSSPRPCFKLHSNPISYAPFNQAKLDQHWINFRARCQKNSNQSGSSQDSPLLINQFCKQNEVTLNRRIVIYREYKWWSEREWIENINNEQEPLQFQYYPPNMMINSPLIANEDDKENINYYGQEEEGAQKEGECFCCLQGCQCCTRNCYPQMISSSFSKRCSTIEQVSEPSNTSMNPFLLQCIQPKPTTSKCALNKDCIANNTRGKSKLKSY